MSLSIPPSPPILDLYGTPPAVLHRPRLAVLACSLFAFAAVAELVAAVAFDFFPPPHPDMGVGGLIYAVSIYTSTCVVVAAAIVLYIADIARHASPRISPWPRRLILMLIVLHAAGCCLEAFGWYLFGPDSFYGRDGFYLLISIVARGSAAAAYTAGFIYALQVAAFLRDKTLHIAAVAVLCPVLLITTGLFFLTTADLTNLYDVDSLFSSSSWLQTCGNILAPAIPTALIVFFLLLAYRIRRAAKTHSVA